MSVYALKPRFQNALRPLVDQLAALGMTANQVTLSAAIGSLILGGLTGLFADHRWVFLLIPTWFLIRMALNAIDGMLAREHGQESALGAFLNETGDVVSDAALYAPFALIAPFNWPWLALVIFLSMLTEFAGVVAASLGAGRGYEGPMGKSDRAVVFGLLAMAVAFTSELPHWSIWLMPILAALLLLTVAHRVKGALVRISEIETDAKGQRGE